MYAKSTKKRISWWLGLSLVALLFVSIASGMTNSGLENASVPWNEQVEPDAGSWHTWVLDSGSQLRPPPPPKNRQTQIEIRELKELAKQRDEAALSTIEFWNTGAPVYRWNEMALNEALSRNQGSIFGGRALAILHTAVSDATIAAWDAKYTYQRRRPSETNRSLKTVIETPRSPSYPAEHAVTAGAASEVLAYLYPDRADFFRAKAREASEAFLLAGVQYRSDVEAGLELGQQVAMLAIARAQNDNSTAAWDGIIPTGPGYWTGQNPAVPMGGSWKTWALDTGSQFRPGPPYAYDSPEMAAEMNEIKTFQRTPGTNSQALFWEWGAGGTRNFGFWNEQLSRKLLEYRMDNNPPRVARAFALESVAYYDSFVACWDAKYTYWAIRPFQLDPTLQTVFPTPNHPRFPSAHSCLSGAAAEVLAYLFPRDSAGFENLAAAAGETRLWAGIHVRQDIVVGLDLGETVAGKVIEIADSDE